MVVVERGDDLGVHDHEVVDDEIGDQRADELAFVVDREWALLIEAVTALGELDEERVFVEFLVQAGTERIEDLHRGADDLFTEIAVDEVAHEAEFFNRG